MLPIRGDAPLICSHEKRWGSCSDSCHGAGRVRLCLDGGAERDGYAHVDGCRVTEPHADGDPNPNPNPERHPDPDPDSDAGCRGRGLEG